MKYLIVVDMQNDFIDGALGTPEALAIVPYVKERIASFDGEVLFTRDTHFEDYLSTAEGKKLPVPHCIRGTRGWEIHPELDALRKTAPIDKITFGAKELPLYFADKEPESVTLLGLCTDICVISNAMLLKAFYPELSIAVDAKGCAGVTPESHENALRAMKMCQIDIL